MNKRFLLALPLALVGCAGSNGEVGGMTKAERCAVYDRTITAMELRLRNPVYLEDDDAVARAKQAIRDVEFAMTVAGCPVTGAAE